ncbi:helicase-associated domain-containing protein [Paenibacillus sp. S150]|uniref:helicase-associated domain-containing protein n=1 Tax=Paenibacillus sp. S150 TaxID=2749826 RepID=UPI001C5A060E|nr:helicase-associated domain-containing protein [Paenibacillus sp. S150]MBW4083951.1 helicase-associated domain-containing protein [Paenibacillus sp. S150]
MKGLSGEALLVLQKLVRACAARPFAEALAERHCPAELCRAELQLALLELREAGLLELRQKLWGEKLYQIPEQRLPELQRLLFPDVPVRAAGKPVSTDEESGPGLPGELFRALVFIAGEGLPFTAKGGVHKKNISRLAAQLSLPEAQLEGLFPPDQRELHPFPLPVVAVLDLLLCLGLIRRTDSAYRLETEVLEGWLRLSEKQMSSLLYGLVLSRFGPPEPAAQHFRYIVSSAEYHSGLWYALPDILEWMSEAGLAQEQSLEPLETSARMWLKGLAGFGWCELGRMEDGTACFRWTAARPQLLLGEAVVSSGRSPGIPGAAVQDAQEEGSSPEFSGFMVQPDFEILVPPECPYSQRWMLAGCAELLHSDDLWSYRLTRERLEAAAEQGLSPEGVLSWLAAHAMGGLPAQAEHTLLQWSRGIGRTALSEMLVLACRSESDGNDIAAHPRLQGSLERIGPLHFIVRTERLEAVRKELGAAGMAPPKRIAGQQAEPGVAWPLLGGDPQAESAAYTFSVHGPVRGLLACAPELPPVPLNPHAAEKAMLTGLASVPQMWIKEWRKYHATTAQKVMEHALDSGIKVRLSMKEQICEFIPAEIRRNPWEVQGALLPPDSDRAEEARLSAADWQEMQLVIPKVRRNSSSA